MPALTKMGPGGYEKVESYCLHVSDAVLLKPTKFYRVPSVCALSPPR